MDLYRPNYSSRDSPPPPPPDMPPLPQGPPPSSRPPRFGTGESQNGYDGSGMMQQNDFAFRANDHAPQFPQSLETYRHTYADERRDAQNEYRLSQANENGRDGHHHPQQRGQRGNRGHRGSYRARPMFHPSSRPLLWAPEGDGPEHNSETLGNLVEAQRFRNTDEMSDSDEAVMNEANGESDASSGADVEEYEPTLESNGLPALTGTQNHGIRIQDESLQTQASAVESDKDVGSAKGESVPPKWSNPEYFTVLPPPDDSTRKKKDVVRLIRKARVALAKTDKPKNQVVANDDFISLDFDEAPSHLDVGMGNALGKTFGQGVPGAPLGPSQPQSQGYRQQQPVQAAPGVVSSTLSASQLGPPPSLTYAPEVRATTVTETVATRQKRKRESDDEDEEFIPRPTKKPKGIGAFSNGRILDEWRMDHTKNPVPWLSIAPQVPTENPGLRLHQEICDFYSFVKPQEYEHIIRTDTLNRIRKAIQNYDPECDLRCFGSFAAGLYLPNSDMDLVIISRNFMRTGRPSVFKHAGSMHNLGSYLRQQGIADPGSLEVISKAKVPIVKFVDQITNLKVDISFENDSGLIANDTFQQWREQYPAMPILVTLIKQFLMMRGLNEVAQGGIGGFSVTCLVVSLLQNLPRVQCGELVPEQHLGEMLMEFLDFYGNQLDISQTGLSMNPPGYFPKFYQPSKTDRLEITDPNNPNNDISGGSRHIAVVFAAFSECRDEILRAMRTPGNKSFLGWMLGGNYSTILWQRQRLRRLYRSTYGSSIQRGGSIRDEIQQKSHYVGPEQKIAPSNDTKMKDNQLDPEGASSHTWDDEIKQLFLLASSTRMVEYAKSATPVGHRTLHQSISKKDAKLMSELAVFTEEVEKSYHSKGRKARIHGETQQPRSLAESAAAMHGLRFQILKTWNPADATKPKKSGRSIKENTFENARETYLWFYTLLQNVLDANPYPGWQEIAFEKPDQGKKSTKGVQTGALPERNLAASNQEDKTVTIKEEDQKTSLGSFKNLSVEGSGSDIHDAGSNNVLLTRQGSSTQDAIMID